MGVNNLFGPEAPTWNVNVVSVTDVIGIERTANGSMPTLGYDLTDWSSSISHVKANDSLESIIPSPTLKVCLPTVALKSPVAGS